MERSKQFVGRNMFYDKQDRLIYMDRKTENLYVITDSEVRALYVLNNRVSIAGMLGLVLYFYMQNVIQVIAIAVIAYALLSIAYRKMFLPRLEIATGITKQEIHIPGDEQMPEGKLEPQTMAKTLLTSLLAIAVSILFYLNVKQTPDMEGTTKILHYVMAIATLGYGLVNAFFLLRISKSQKLGK